MGETKRPIHYNEEENREWLEALVSLFYPLFQNRVTLKQTNTGNGKQYWSLHLLQSTRGNTMYSDHDVHVGVKVSKVRAQVHTVPVRCIHFMGSQSR